MQSPAKRAFEHNRINGEFAALLFQARAAVGSVRMGICEGEIEVVFVKKEGGKWRGRAEVDWVREDTRTARTRVIVVWAVGMAGTARRQWCWRLVRSRLWRNAYGTVKVSFGIRFDSFRSVTFLLAMEERGREHGNSTDRQSYDSLHAASPLDQLVFHLFPAQPSPDQVCMCLAYNATITHVLPRRMIDALRLRHRSA